MKNTFVVVAAVVLGVTAFLAGTAISSQGVEEKKVGPPMAMPPPPPQLKALDAFVGDWRGEYEHLPAMFGEATPGTGRGKTEWVLDGRFVMGEGTGTSSYGTHKAIWLMTYDPKMQSYRSFSFDNFGTCEIATATHDPKDRTWTFLSDGYHFASGEPCKYKYTMRFVSDDKMEWHWYAKAEGETDFELLMRGTDTRVSARR